MQVPPLEPARAAFAVADELNETAVALGYAVLVDTTVTASPAATTDSTVYTVRQLGGPTVHATGDPDSVRRYLDELAGQPRWRLDLEDPSIEIDGAVITDKQTRQTITLQGGWAPFIGNCATVDQFRTTTGIHHLSVVGEAPPAVGAWHRWPAPVAND
ncbi:hypothetical protein [Nocardia sp. NPDC004722]